MTTTAIFGAGVMGETLVSGLIRSGREAADLVITGRSPDKVNALAERYGVRAIRTPRRPTSPTPSCSASSRRT